MCRRQKLLLRKQQSESVAQIAGEPTNLYLQHAPGTCALCGQPIAPPSLPGIGAEAGQVGGCSDRSLQPAPQGITYQHDENTIVTMPIVDAKDLKIVLRDQSEFHAALNQTIGVAQQKVTEPAVVTLGGRNFPPPQGEVKFTPRKNKGGRPKGSKNKVKVHH